jgi:DNA-binding CsgD family transcriptional regulator
LIVVEGGQPMTSQLIDRIYECAFVPELWPSVLDELAKIAEARGGFLFAANKEVRNWTASASLQAGMHAFVSGRYYETSSRANRAIGARHAGFLREHDIYTDEELADDPIYRDLLWPVGLGWGAATVIPAPTGDVLFLSVERRRSLGPVETAAIHQLDDLRPHLACSALMSARLQMERARIASETLAAIGLAALVIDENGKVLAVNPLIEAMPQFVQWRAQDHIALKDKNADKLLRDAIVTIDLSRFGGVRSFPVRDAETQTTVVAHVIPIRLSARDLFVRCAAVLILTPLTLPKAPPVELVQSLFDLTPAEARVARGLASGKTVDDISMDGGISSNTIRTHMRGVLQKTGCNRQVDVVALLTGISSARIDSA